MEDTVPKPAQAVAHSAPDGEPIVLRLEDVNDGRSDGPEILGGDPHEPRHSGG